MRSENCFLTRNKMPFTSQSLRDESRRAVIEYEVAHCTLIVWMIETQRLIIFDKHGNDQAERSIEEFLENKKESY